MVRGLKNLREKRGLTQLELSRMSSVPRVCISRYETGETKPNYANMSKLSNALGVTFDDLFAEVHDDTDAHNQPSR